MDNFCIQFVQENTRSYKKLLPALEQFPEATIVTADDDVAYPSDWLQTLLIGHAAHPSAVVGTRGARIALAPDGAPASYSSWPRLNAGVGRDVFLTGRGGILYPPDSLHPRVRDIASALDLCPTADDIWFKAMSLLNGRECAVVDSRGEYPRTSLRPHSGLHAHNVGMRANDRQVRAVGRALGIRFGT